MAMNQQNTESYVKEAHRPDGLYEAILEPTFTDKIPEYHERLAVVSADIALHLIETLGADTRTANKIAARAVQEMLAATAITLDQDELGVIDLMSQHLTGRVLDDTPTI